jgi:hypothetical protein
MPSRFTFATKSAFSVSISICAENGVSAICAPERGSLSHEKRLNEITVRIITAKIFLMILTPLDNLGDRIDYICDAHAVNGHLFGCNIRSRTVKPDSVYGEGKSVRSKRSGIFIFGSFGERRFAIRRESG